MKSYVFPGQGAQFTGMGKDLYDNSQKAKELFEKANKILNFDITKIMFEGTAEDLKQTKVTQPAVFLHSVILSKVLGNKFIPDMVAGHSLGEFSAITANGTLDFKDGLNLVYKRAMAMQEACDIKPSTMAVILGLEDAKVEGLCEKIEGIIVPANYNCIGQLVISGDIEAIEKACILAKDMGAKRALQLPVGGAFHSPLMEPAREKLEMAINQIEFKKPICPVYQNVNALPTSNSLEIKKNLILQLTAPVRWTQTVQNMIKNGATNFIELGPGNVLQGLIKKIDRNVETSTEII